jgi:O-antigen/teichoic acid export membrane protein
LVLLALGWGIWSLVAQVLVAALVATASLWRISPWRPGWQADLRSARPLLVYGGHRLATQVIDFANTRYVEVFLAATLGPVSLAVYAVGVRLHLALMQAVSSAVLDVAHNGFSRLANDRPALMDAYYRSITATATVAVPVFLLVAAVSGPLTAVVFGERWADSAAVMQLMALMGAVQVLQFYNGTVYNAIGRPEVGLYFMALKVALSLGALLLARDGGLTLLVQAYVASQLLTAPLSFLLARRLIGVSMRQLVRRCWPFLAGAGAMALTAAWVVGRLGAVLPPVLVLLLASTIGCGVYLAWLAVLRPASLRAAWWTVRGKTAVAVKQG